FSELNGAIACFSVKHQGIDSAASPLCASAIRVRQQYGLNGRVTSAPTSSKSLSVIERFLPRGNILDCFACARNDGCDESAAAGALYPRADNRRRRPVIRLQDSSKFSTTENAQMARAARTKLPQPVFHEPIFGEDGSLPDPTGFSTKHGSDNALYKQIGDLTSKDVVPIPKSRIADDEMYSLADAYGSHGPEIVKKITAAGKIIFHSLGDSGASNAGKYPKELRVADQVTLDSASSDEANRAAFLYHLGDVVYNFGAALYYYAQFYDPFRNYPAPIFAIPGNHDSFIVPGTKP